MGCCAHCRPQCWPGVWVDRWALQTWGADSSLGALPTPISDQLQQIMHAATCTQPLPPLGCSLSCIIDCYIKAKASNQIGKQLQLRSVPNRQAAQLGGTAERKQWVLWAVPGFAGAG